MYSLWPYLFQNADRVPAALQTCGETGRRWRVVILRRLGEKLGYRYLIRHPAVGYCPNRNGNLYSGNRTHEKW